VSAKSEAAQKAITDIAADIGFETLEERKVDSLDFREVSVRDLRWALEAAYEAGVQAAKNGEAG
jgi:hypothetical protein